MTYDEPLDNRCSLCLGRGKAFYQSSPEHRREIDCPRCGGSGKLSDVMTKLLLNGKLADLPPSVKGWWEK